MEVTTFSAPVRILAALDAAIVDVDTLHRATRPWILGGRQDDRVSGVMALGQSTGILTDTAAGTPHERWAAQGATLIKPPDDARELARGELRAHAAQAQSTIRTMRMELLDRVESGDDAIPPAAPAADDTRLVAARLDVELAIKLRSADHPADPVRRHMLELFLRDPSDLSRGEWRHMHRVLSDESLADLLPRIGRESEELPLADMANMRGRGTYSTGAPTRKAFARMALALDGTVDDPNRMREHLNELIQRDPRGLTGSDWARIDVILRTARTADLGFTVPKRTDTHRGAMRLDVLLEGLTDARFEAGRGTFRHVRALREAVQPGSNAERDAHMLDAFRRGEVPADATSWELAPDAPIWDTAGAQDVRGHAARLRMLALAKDRPVTQAHAHQFLDGVETELKLVPGDDPTIAGIIEQIDELVAANRLRLGSRTPRGAAGGYGRYPEFAELGRIASNVELVARLAHPVDAPHLGASVTPVVEFTDDAGAIAW